MKRTVLLLLLSMLVTTGYTQGKAAKKKLKKARGELVNANYDAAKQLYQEALALAPSDPEILFETGLAYFNSEVEKERSLEYFQQALTNSTEDTIPEVIFYLGRAYHYTEQFEKAVDAYNLFKSFMKKNDDGTLLARDVDRFIEMCNNGARYASEKDSKIQVVNVGERVNTTYAEYAPVVKKDESLLLYTGRKRGSTGDKFYHDGKYYEDIYVSLHNRQNKEWSWATKFDSSDTCISSRINTKWHDAAIAYSDDEKKLFIYRENHVWISDLKDGKWTDPVRMGGNINSKGHEPSAFLTADEQTLFVVSNRKEGFGGRDIYWTTKDGSGNWKPLKNLGPLINTRFDEDAPVFMKDGKTLYFSSNGHTTMGGYDVFKTTLNRDSTWTVPENLGIPINSAGDDIYYTPDEKNIYAYHSSSRMNGFGDMDIYRIQLDCENLPNTEIRGKLYAGAARMPLGGRIVVTDSLGNNVGEFPVDPETGNYVLVLPPERKYTMELFTPVNPWERDRPHRQQFFVPKQCEPYALYQEVNLRHLTSPTSKIYGQEADFANVMFNVEDSVRKHYNIEAPGSNITPQEEQLTLTGKVMFNKALVAPGTTLYLMNEDMEIVRATTTLEDGTYAFNNLHGNQEYTLALDADHLKNIYYGINPNNADNGILALGTMERIKGTNASVREMADSVEVLLINNNKKIVNATRTSVGQWSIDNINVNGSAIQKMNDDLSITYNLAQDGMDYAISAYIRTTDNTNNTSYSEFIDLIRMDTTAESIPQSLIAFENIYFDFDKYFLRDNSKEILDKIYNYMAANPTAKIRMDGHCDWMGTDEYNEGLSKNRSNSAYNYLIGRGISPTRIDRQWFGESKPAVPNAYADGRDNPENRQLNRRVEFKITTSDMALTITTF